MSNPLDNPLGLRRHQRRRRNIRLIPPRTTQEKTDIDDQRYNTAGYHPRQAGSNTFVSDSPDRALLGVRLVTELNGARFQSDDLVDDVFGHFIPASLVGVVLAGLLKQKLVKVTYGNGSLVSPQHHPSAIAWAVCHAERAGCIPDTDSPVPAVEPKSRENNYAWTWTLPDNPNRRTETGAARFMNSVAEEAFKEIHEQAPTALGRRWIQWRFGRPPYPDYAYPMPEVVENVDQRLDNHVLPTTAWSVLDKVEEQAPEDILPSEPELSNSDHLDLTYAADSLAEEEYDPARDKILISDLQAAYRDTQNRLHVTAAKGAWDEYTNSRSRDESVILDEGYANWTRTRAVVELKASDLNKAIRQTHLYLRTLHRAQPWLASAHGIAMTENQLCLLRSDAAGCEECSFKLSTGRGIIDTIRVALGTVTAQAQEFGYNPNFTHKYQSRLVETSRHQGTHKKQKVTVNYHCHVVDTIKRGDDIFKVEETIHTTASIRGRGTIVFKVRREDDEKSWALKRTWVDVCSESKENELMELARKRGVEYVLLPEPGDCWTCLDTDFMRGDAPASQPRDLKVRGVFAEVELRQETYCLLPYKLPIHHFRDAKDFVSGMICILKGLESLYTKAGIIHGDVSFNNLLFDEDESTPRRAWLFDLDNASIEKPRAKQTPDLMGAFLNFKDKDRPTFPVITGTGPFMALDVMKGFQRMHASDQIESVFYIIFLFFFTFGKPGMDPFLNKSLRWHHKLEGWTTGSLASMCQAKYDFFAYPNLAMLDLLQERTCPEWQEEPGKTKESIGRLICSVYAVLWQVIPTRERFGQYAVVSAKAEDLIKCLEAWLEAHP
ncbi:hypothetical protein C8R47DRAFT_501064 [Mycena vitilis]|nr:hypothetical protein C8R47DRAFT_501064 [Mycena vitilis]